MDEDNLKIIDTTDGLTREELRELKRLAHMSKFARALFAILIGVVALFGIDHITSWIRIR